MDPGVVVAIVTGVFLLLSALIGFRSRREEAATTGLSDLIKGLQAEVTRQDSRISRLEATVEERDGEIATLRATNAALTAENRRLTELSVDQAARLVELETGRAVMKAADSGWDGQGDLL